MRFVISPNERLIFACFCRKFANSDQNPLQNPCKYGFRKIRSPRQNGTFPLKLAVTHKKFFLINLKVYFAKEEWERGAIIQDNGEVILPNRKADVAYINQRLSQARTILYQPAALGKLNKITR